MWTPATRRQHGRDGLRYQTDLTDAEWAIVEPLMAEPCLCGRPRAWPLREIVNAIFYVLRGGIAWRLMPKDLPPRTTVYRWFALWRDTGLFERMNHLRVMADRERVGRDPSPTAAVIDSHSVKTTESGGPRGYDAGKKVQARKRQVVVDTDGRGLILGPQPADESLPLRCLIHDPHPAIGTRFMSFGPDLSLGVVVPLTALCSGIASRWSWRMDKPLLDREHWTRVAAEWTAWARSPKHDAFWAYREALIDYIGEGTGKVLDVGCGEGRVSRELKALGYHVTATDTVAELIEAARQADSAHEFAVADARDLPFEDSSFDLVVIYNVLMDVEDVPATLRELRRVVHPNGQLFISLVHPFRDLGNFASSDPDAPFVLKGTYFGRQRFEGVEERGGLTMHFAGWSQPLEAYAAAQQAGVAITSLREPTPDHAEGQEHLKQWMRVPLFLWLKARPLPPAEA